MGSDPNQMVMIKMSGGDGVVTPLYFDIQANRNYDNAKAEVKIPFMYHFYGGGDPIVEADWFLKAVSPLADGDGLAVDIERATYWNPQTDPQAVAKVFAFVQHIHAQTGVWPWVYMNISTANMYDWSPVFQNCALWCAAPSFSFDASLPVKYMVVAQQGPIVDSHDTNAFFGSLDELRAYTYHDPTPQPAPQPVIPAAPPVPEPVQLPVPAIPPAPVVVIPPSPTPTVQQTPEPQVTKQGVNMQRLTAIATFLRKHLPVVLVALPVVLQALIDKGVLTVPTTTILLVNAALTAAGITVIHQRTQQ